jgi:drug/metabolite transporter (DMT)-like permease
MDLPDSKQISAGAQMMCGGILLLVCALLAGELTPPPHVDMRAALATLYLTVVGSILAFTAYIWLLARMSSTRVASYAYVNPVVALAIGAWLGNERLTIQTIVGAALIVASVALILTSERANASRS